MWPPNAGSSVSVEKLDRAMVRSGLAWAHAGPDRAEPARIKVNRDTATPRLDIMNHPSVLGFRMRATGAPPDLTLEGGQTASAGPPGRSLRLRPQADPGITLTRIWTTPGSRTFTDKRRLRSNRSVAGIPTVSVLKSAHRMKTG